ncbi:Squamosa promoter-binding-like protein 3 [Tetrabaena socialis]|uniref:Squamosa promoter-binding-like protein 3 n=1 Tax=Tetrabaena socialis TaxID=47790 RepID=A0A2J8AEI5_9CHLO|nr:Squamosa promoter-binding-like protein 3 [Tetrabaena socialis]|eukprot:PNH10935.1 Squamosa promoter-binding-like protein 3 [Tetrabaena socialis]
MDGVEPARGPSSTAGGMEVEGCLRDMSLEKVYYRRYSVCEAHLRALELLVDGRIQRFCQQV